MTIVERALVVFGLEGCQHALLPKPQLWLWALTSLLMVRAGTLTMLVLVAKVECLLRLHL